MKDLYFRRVYGTKSTAGGVLESIAPLIALLWPDLDKFPDLQALLQDLTAEELEKARKGIKEMAEPAKKRRSFRRNRTGHLKSAFATYANHTKGQRPRQKK